MPPTLDVVIGTIFVFLLFSLVVSALNEFILSLLDRRAKFLQMGLKGLLGDDNRVTDLCKHGLINALSRSDTGLGRSKNQPSYIPAGAFVSSLFDLILHKWADNKTPDAAAGANSLKCLSGIPELSGGVIPKELTDYINSLPEDQLKQSLRSLLTVAGQDIGTFKAAVEGWFNDAMDRVIGWYKRYAQKWMLVIALALAAALNVDTVRIIKTLSSNPNLAKAVAEQAESYVEKNQPPAAVPVAPENKDEDLGRKAPDKAAADFKARIANLKDTGIPMGWENAHFDWTMLVGWLVTALAASLGAPFWFDLLGRFMIIGNAGKAPNEKDPTGKIKNERAATLNTTPGKVA